MARLSNGVEGVSGTAPVKGNSGAGPSKGSAAATTGKNPAKGSGAGSIKPTATSTPPSYGGGGGGGGGLPGGAAAPSAGGPSPIRDIDWFNQDSIYRQEAGGALADLTEQLARVMAERDEQFRGIDRSREDFGRAREQGLAGVGQDFAARGLLGSGLFAQGADRAASEYARAQSQFDRMEQDAIQNYGQRGAQVDLNTLSGLANNGMGDINPILGLLGAMGIGAGNQYGQAIAQAMAQSAGRAAQPLTQTINW